MFILVTPCDTSNLASCGADFPKSPVSGSLFVEIGLPTQIQVERFGETACGFLIQNPLRTPNRYQVLFCLVTLLLNWGPNLGTYVLPALCFPAAIRSTCHGLSSTGGRLGGKIGVASGLGSMSWAWKHDHLGWFQWIPQPNMIVNDLLPAPAACFFDVAQRLRRNRPNNSCGTGGINRYFIIVAVSPQQQFLSVHSESTREWCEKRECHTDTHGAYTQLLPASALSRTTSYLICWMNCLIHNGTDLPWQ